MNTLWRVITLLLIAGIPSTHGAPLDGVQTLELTVDGVPRTALVYVPPHPAPGKLPLVFAFHGHGGNSRNALNTFKIDRLWPEAISVYPQGLDTPGILSDPDGKKPGWQNAVGKLDDRDLHFFDAMLARLQKDYPVDPARIYCTGHSNGGGFTYLLWLTHPDTFAAFAPCSAAAIYAAQLKPKPAMVSGGRQDPTVKFQWQEMMMESIKKTNGCDGTGVPWEGGAGTLYGSTGGPPLVTYLYDGGHMMNRGESEWIVKFFQSQPAPASPGAAGSPPP